MVKKEYSIAQFGQGGQGIVRPMEHGAGRGKMHREQGYALADRVKIVYVKKAGSQPPIKPEGD